MCTDRVASALVRVEEEVNRLHISSCDISRVAFLCSAQRR